MLLSPKISVVYILSGLAKGQKGKVQYLEYTTSNVCNQKCVMCSSKFSTQWADIESIFGRKSYPTQSLSDKSIDKIIKIDKILLYLFSSLLSSWSSVCLSEGVGWTLPQLNSCGGYYINLAHILVHCHLTISCLIHRILFVIRTLLVSEMLY